MPLGCNQFPNQQLMHGNFVFRRKKHKKELDFAQLQSTPVCHDNEYQVSSKMIKIPKRHIASGIRNKIQKLRKALEEQKQLRRNKKRCEKHLKNLQQKDEEMFITANDIYDSRDLDDKEKLKYDKEYCDIDESNVYDDPVGKTNIQIFQDEGKVKVKKVIGILENEYESIETQYYEVIEEIADLVDIHIYEELDENEHLYHYIDPAKLDQIKKANKERKHIESKKITVKTVIKHLDAMDVNEMVHLEDVYAVPEKHELRNGKVTSNGEKPKYTMEDEEYSIYVKQIIGEKFGDEKQGRVKELISLFEGKMENLKETQDKVINKMTDMVEEETTKLEEEIVENEIYEKFNTEHEENSQMNGKDGKVQELINMYNKQNILIKPDHNLNIHELSQDDSVLGNDEKRDNNTGGKQELDRKPIINKVIVNNKDDPVSFVDNELYTSTDGIDNVVMVDNELYSSSEAINNDPFMVENELYATNVK